MIQAVWCPNITLSIVFFWSINNIFTTTNYAPLFAWLFAKLISQDASWQRHNWIYNITFYLWCKEYYFCHNKSAIVCSIASLGSNIWDLDFIFVGNTSSRASIKNVFYVSVYDRNKYSLINFGLGWRKTFFNP